MATLIMLRIRTPITPAPSAPMSVVSEAFTPWIRATHKRKEGIWEQGFMAGLEIRVLGSEVHWKSFL